MMARKDEFENISNSLEETLEHFFRHRAEVLLAYIFGSYLAKSRRRFRDIDIAVLVLPDLVEKLNEKKPYGYEGYMISELAHLLKYSAIDFVLLNNGSPLLQHQVITKGKLIFCRSESERIRFETSALHRYADTAHLRKIKRLYMKKRIEKGLDAYVWSAGNRAAFIEWGLQILIQNVLDIGAHLLASDTRNDWDDYGEVIIKLGQHGIIPEDFSKRIQGMAGLWNILVHEYIRTDVAIIYGFINKQLGDFVEFMSHIQKYLERTIS